MARQDINLCQTARIFRTCLRWDDTANVGLLSRPDTCRSLEGHLIDWLLRGGQQLGAGGGGVSAGVACSTARPVVQSGGELGGWRGGGMVEPPGESLCLLSVRSKVKQPLAVHYTAEIGAVWKSRWPSWAPRPNELYGFCGRKATMNHWSQFVPNMPTRHPRTLSSTLSLQSS